MVKQMRGNVKRVHEGALQHWSKQELLTDKTAQRGKGYFAVPGRRQLTGTGMGVNALARKWCMFVDQSITPG
jgi:hypothetical protein